MPLVGGGRLPLAFITAGLLMLAGAVVALLFRPDLLLLPYSHPQVVGLVHLWLPGFLLSVCIGAIYQLMPVVLGVPPRLRLSGAWIHWALHVASVVVLVRGFWTAQFGWVALGGAGVTLGLGVLGTTLFRTFAASPRRDAPAWCFPLAAGWLLLTVVAGVALALNRRWPYLPLPVTALLQAHAHLGLAGFFLSLLQGVTFQLVPMFTMGDAARPKLIRAGLWITQAALLFLIPGLAFSQPLLTGLGAGLLVLSLACSGVALHATLQTRRRRLLETGLRAFVVGAACFIAVALLGVSTLIVPDVSTGPLPALYGLLLVGGGLSLTVLGMLCKIVPFLVWMRAYGPVVGKRPVPVATTLGHAVAERLWLRLHFVALLVLSIGVLTSHLLILRLGAGLLAVALLALFTSFARVIRHLFVPVVTPLPPRVVPAHPTLS